MSLQPPHDRSPPHGGGEDAWRVQLEGAWEVLEQARERQDSLLKSLALRRWRQHLCKRPEVVREVLDGESSLAGALPRAEHRLQRESSPEQHPLGQLLRQLREQRARMQHQVRARLASLGTHEDLGLLEGLERLERELRALSWPPGEDEPVLFTGGIARWVFIPAVLLIGLIAALTQGFANAGQRWWVPLVPGLCFTLVLLLQQSNIRRYWLTSRRVVWKPILGELQQLPLESIRPESIARNRSDRSWGDDLQVDGLQRATLSGLQGLELMEALLRIHCGPPLRGRRLSPPTYPLLLLPATRRMSTVSPGHRTEPGLLVVRPDWIAFLPDSGVDGMIRALFGAWPTGRPFELTPLLILRQLCLLPAEEFDRCVEAAVDPAKGDRWATSRLVHDPKPPGGGYQLTILQGPLLTLFPTASQREALLRILDPGSPRAPVGRGGQRSAGA